MDMVRRFASSAAAILFALFSSCSNAGDRPIFCGTERWQPIIAEAAARSGIPAQWLHAVMRAESAGCAFMHNRPTTSSWGAMGLMQLMPTTWSQMSRRLGMGDDPYQPYDNVMAGAVYLRELYDRFGSPGFIAAYHAGPERYEAALRGNRSLPAETVDYIARVLSVADLPTGSLAMRVTDSTFFRCPFVMRDSQLVSTGSTLDRPPHETPFVQLARTRRPLWKPVGGQPDVQGK
jgi:Transglycosylase SLT domain